MSQRQASKAAARCAEATTMDAGFADLKPSQPVNHATSRIVNRLEPARQILQLFLGHAFIGFIVEIQGAPAPRLVADNAFEDRGCPIVGALDTFKN